MRGERPQHGFTLIELLLALAMVSVLAMSLYASLRVAFKARDSAMAAIGPARAAHMAMDMLRRDLESVLPPTGIMAGSFIGQHLAEGAFPMDALEFYCLGGRPDDFEPTLGGMRKVELSVVTPVDGTSNVLVRYVTSNLLASVVPEPDEEVICRGVRAFSLRYYDGFTWLDTWDSTLVDNVLPMAIEATLEIGWPPQKDPPDTIYKTTRIFTPACCQYAELGAVESSAGTGTGGGQ